MFSTEGDQKIPFMEIAYKVPENRKTIPAGDQFDTSYLDGQKVLLKAFLYHFQTQYNFPEGSSRSTG